MVCSISSLCAYVSFKMLEVGFQHQQGPNLSAPRGRQAARGGRGTRHPRSRTSCRSLCERTSSPWSPSAIGYLTSVFAGASVAVLSPSLMLALGIFWKQCPPLAHHVILPPCPINCKGGEAVGRHSTTSSRQRPRTTIILSV